MDARRRTVLTAAAAGAAGLVTACGSSGDGASTTSAPETSPGVTPSTKASATPPKGSPASGTASATASKGSTASGTVLAKTSDIPVGGGTIFTEQKVVVTQPKKGEFKGFSAICVHAGCTVDSVSDGTINCPCHGSKYRITDAAVVAGPAPGPLPTERITVTGDTIRLA
ncbi:Rieske (2Fe-2S) protein [Streptomyces sp. NPDC048411]|uniref:Rieske (2Fe-2S) protein n=1 Tax=Streptomyces sp. NPDC048411 TaxID=3157206 RepID=UPI0034537C7F